MNDKICNGHSHRYPFTLTLHCYKPKLLPLAICTVAVFSIDLAYAYHPVSPYAHTLNNPVRYVDPNGMDVYRYDDRTGDMMLHLQTDDDFDQVGRFKYDRKTDTYTLRTNRNGEARTRMDNVEKGILSDGMNFMTNDNSWSIGGEGQPTVEGITGSYSTSHIMAYTSFSFSRCFKTGTFGAP